MLSGGTFWRTESLGDKQLPTAILSDGPHGLRFQDPDTNGLALVESEPATCFPPAVTMASTWDEDLIEQVGHAVGVEARALGVDVVLGPGLNIKRHPFGGRNFEYYSEDPVLSGRCAAAAVRGIQSAGVGACLKHFAVNNQESYRMVVDAVVDERTLREIYLAGFEHAVITSKPWTVMASYNSVNGTAATESDHLIREILRGEWGFDGMVMSDWSAVGDRAAGVAAGMDLEMPSSRGLSDGAVMDAVRAGRLDEQSVTACAQRVLDLVARSPRHASGTIPVDEHDALARRAAAAGTVLLRNDGTLPLSPGVTVALIGATAESPRFQGGGSSQVVPTRITTALDEFRRRGVEFSYLSAYDPNTGAAHADRIAAAADMARAADIAVVMVGLPDIAESEGFDRSTLALPDGHNQLMAEVCAANPRTVVSLSNGSPVTLPWADDVAAILESYLGGQASGGALVDVLYGDVEPGGRLAETFPRSARDVAADPFFPGQPHQVEYREGLFVGYRHFVTADIEPAFAFGHGSGYTTFEWSSIGLGNDSVAAGDDIDVSVTVTNIGERTGSDVVQVYLGDRTGIVCRPARTLATFAKVELEPGESRTLALTIPARAFQYFDVIENRWATPEGVFEVEVARSSVDIVQTLTAEVTNGVRTSADPAGAPPIASTDADFTRRLGRAIPIPRPVRPFTRDSTIGEIAQTRIGALLKAMMWRFGPASSGEPDETTKAAVKRGFEELPLRGAAVLSGGKLRWATVDAIVDLANRRPDRLIGRVAQWLTRKVPTHRR
nr:glycoside hydrolase family 3 C-terminal domain-containing protein [Flexivirga meconopsidis]